MSFDQLFNFRDQLWLFFINFIWNSVEDQIILFVNLKVVHFLLNTFKLSNNTHELLINVAHLMFEYSIFLLKDGYKVKSFIH